MIYIFYIIFSSFLYYVLEINGFSVNNRNKALNENEINSSFNDSEIVTESGSAMLKHKSLFHIIQNPNEVPDLKSNIFDKMLSNEMLSIKQQLYDKNETNVSPFYITFKNNIATPTLELKQRWLIEKSLPQLETEHKNTDINTVCTINNQHNLSTSNMNENNIENNNKLNDSIHSKILGVRSFAAMPDNHLERSNYHQCTKRQCTCMKTNAHSTCRFRCSEHKMQTCTQTENHVTVDPQYTRNILPFTYYPYYVYSTLFLGVPTDSSIAYYQPDVINELKLPINKHSYHKKPSVDNLYLDSDDNKYYDENKYLDNEYLDEENSKITKHRKSKYKKGKTKRPKKVKKVYFIDFKKENPPSKVDKLTDGYIQVLDKDEFVENVVEDLKVYYSDAVIKDCYCSLSSFRFMTANLIIYVSILLMLMY